MIGSSFEQACCNRFPECSNSMSDVEWRARRLTKYAGVRMNLHPRLRSMVMNYTGALRRNRIAPEVGRPSTSQLAASKPPDNPSFSAAP
jgi:hypothetical protein